MRKEGQGSVNEDGRIRRSQSTKFVDEGLAAIGGSVTCSALVYALLSTENGVDAIKHNINMSTHQLSYTF